MLAVVYARVSTEDQAKHGYSLEGQEEACKQKANELGATQILVFKDEGVTGSILERRGLQQALAAVKAGANLFIVYDPDRLSRKLAHQLLLAEMIEKAGCRLEFVNFEWQNTPEGKLFYSLRGAIAEYEKEKFLARSRFGKLTKARKGMLTHDPRTFGYNYTQGSFEIDEKEAKLYRQMVGMAFSGMSPERIASLFNEAGYPGPKGGKWRRATVRRILKSPVYTGTIYLNRYCAEGVKSVRAAKRKASPTIRPKEEWIAVSVPPLITKQEWEDLQEALERTKKGKRGTKVNRYILSGFLYCGECGAPLHGTSGTGKKGQIYRYYACSNRHMTETDRKYSSKPCPSQYYRADRLERSVWEKVKEWLIDPEALVRDLQSEKTVSATQREKENLFEQDKSLEKEKERVFMAYRHGVIEFADFTKAMEEINRARESVKKRLREIEAIEESRRQLEKETKTLRALADEVVSRIDDLSDQEIEQVIRMLVNKVTVNKDDIILEARLARIRIT